MSLSTLHRTNENSLWLLGVVSVFLLSTAARLYQITVPVLWLDEAFSVRLAAMPPTQILLHTARDVHPPFYYLLLHYWMLLFGSEVALVRGLSVVTGVATVMIGMAMAGNWASRRAAVFAGLLLALLPVAVRYSQEARMYSLLGMLLLASTFALVCWVREPTRYRYLAVYSVLLVAALYTHYFSFLCVMAQWLYMLMLSRSDHRRLIACRAWWIANLLVMLAYLPWLPSLWGQQQAHAHSFNWISPVSGTTLATTFWQFLTLGGGEGYNVAVFWILPMAWVIIALIVARDDDQKAKPSLLLFCYSFVPLVLALLGAYITPLYTTRYLSFVACGWPVMLAQYLEKIARQHVKLAVGLLGACLALQGVGLSRLYEQASNLNGATDWRNIRLNAVVENINSRWQVGDVMVVGGLFWYYTVDYYNRTGTRPLVYQGGVHSDGPEIASLSFGWPTLLAPRLRQLLVPELSKLTSRSRRVWWVGTSVAPLETPQWPNDWRLLARFADGDAFALLFLLPESDALH